MSRTITGALILAAGLAGMAQHVSGAQAPATTGPNLRIEGDWVRTDPEGSGSFDGLAANYPKAELRPDFLASQAGRGAGGRGGPAGGRGGPAGRGAPAGDTTPHEAGQPYVVSAMPCGGGRGGANNYGSGLINPDSGGVHIVESKDQVIFAGERGGARFIYLDGRTHPDASLRAASGAGHSTGHYEGNVLVVDTVGLTAGAVPGGGQRTPETHLQERFQVSPNGKQLTITYTWDDPKIYARPHTYRLIFDRAPELGGLSYALEEWCDASDPIEGQSIVPPKQL
jgi:hypothetical protein